MSFDEPLLIDTDGVATRLSLARRAIQNLIYAGELQSVCIGRARRVLLSDLHAFIQEKKTAAVPSSAAISSEAMNGGPNTARSKG